MRTAHCLSPALAALALAAVSLGGLSVPAPATAAQAPVGGADGPDEFEVRAAYLYNFTKFVTWPEKSFQNGTFTIGVLGDDPFDPVVRRSLESKTVQGMRIVFRRAANPEEAAACNMVYVAAGEEKRLTALFQRLQGQPVLTVGDAQGFLRGGGMIRFRTLEERVQFDVSLAPVSESRLEISSRLLQVARVVLPDGRKEQ